MRTIFSLTSALVLLSTCANAVLNFTQPTALTSWQVGTNVTIRWIAATNTQLSPNNVTIELVRGNPKAFTAITPAIAIAPESAGTVNYTVWANLTAGNDYALRANGTVYSAMFNITAAAKTTPTTPTTATPPGGDTKTATPTPQSAAQANGVGASTGALLIACVAFVEMFST